MTSDLYRLSEFGWLQFEQACSLILVEAGGGELEWVGRADSGRIALVDGPVRGSDGVAVLDGPLTAVVVWARPVVGWERGELDVAGSGDRFAQIVEALPEELGFMFQDRVLVLSNLHRAAAEKALTGSGALRGRRVVVWGCAELSAWLDRRAILRQSLPCVLGSRDLSRLIAPPVVAASSLEVEPARLLARVFWPTAPYARAREVLARHRFVVLTGPPEMGKTAIAQMLGLAQMTCGWEAHQCTSPDQLLRVFDRRRRQVFIADDAFGSTEYRPDAAERWALALGRLLAMLDDEHWLIWTSRPAPLKAGLRRVQRERGSERFPSPGEVLVDAGELDLAEKTLILFRHAKARGASAEARELLRSAALSIVEHPHFTPERIRRFAAEGLELLGELGQPGGAESLQAVVRRQLAAPTEAMRTSFRALSEEHRALLIALLDAPAGLIDQRALTATLRRQGACGLSSSPDALIDRLTDHFLRVTPLGIGWVHPSWRDLVIEELREDAVARRRFLEGCGVEGAILALSSGGGLGERRLPLLIDDADWDVLVSSVRRLLRALEPGELGRVLLALEDAIAVSGRGAERVELWALASGTLELVADRWRSEHLAVPRFLIESWYRLCAACPGPLARPPLAWTWAELHPGSPGHGELDRAELVRVDDWLALAQTLAEYDLGALRELGFLDRDEPVLTELVAELQRTRDPEVGELVDGILTRIGEVAPRHGEVVDIARRVLELSSRPEPRWWVPSDLAAPPSSERVSPVSAGFTRADVGRVLADL